MVSLPCLRRANPPPTSGDGQQTAPGDRAAGQAYCGAQVTRAGHPALAHDDVLVSADTLAAASVFFLGAPAFKPAPPLAANQPEIDPTCCFLESRPCSDTTVSQPFRSARLSGRSMASLVV